MALRRPVGPLRLDRKNQLTAGIIDVFAPLHAVNPVSGLRLGLVGTAASAQPSAAGLAQFTSGSSSSGLAVSAAPANVRVDEVTLLIITTPTSVGAATSFMYGFGSTGSSNPILAIGQSDTASQLYFFVRSDSGTLQNPSVTPPSGTWANNQPAVLVGTRSQARNLHEFYVNGHRAASTTATTIGATTLNTTAVGLLRRTSDGLFYAGYTTLCVAWNRYLSAAEIKRLSDDPWALFTWEFLPVKAASGTTHTSTGAVTGAGATVAGSSVHYTKHTTTGAVQGAGASVAGASTNFTTHTTTGAVTGAGATVAGSATHPHTTSGAVTGGGAAVAGAAEVFTGATHTTSGAVQGGGASVAGTATHLTLHTTTGAVQGAGATVAGAATHLTLHTTAGDVQGGGASVAGAAELISLNGGKSSYLRQWLMAYYEAEWAQKDAVIAQAPLPAVAPKPVVQVARALAKKTVHAAVAATPKAPHRAPQAADPRAAVNEFIQRQTAAVAKRARAAAQSDTQSLAALASRQQQRAAEAEEAEDEEILLLAAVL